MKNLISAIIMLYFNRVFSLDMKKYILKENNRKKNIFKVDFGVNDMKLNLANFII